MIPVINNSDLLAWKLPVTDSELSSDIQVLEYLEKLELTDKTRFIRMICSLSFEEGHNDDTY